MDMIRQLACSLRGHYAYSGDDNCLRCGRALKYVSREDVRRLPREQSADAPTISVPLGGGAARVEALDAGAPTVAPAP